MCKSFYLPTFRHSDIPHFRKSVNPSIRHSVMPEIRIDNFSKMDQFAGMAPRKTIKPRILAIAQGKGGAGKSTLALGVAIGLKGTNRDVIVVDSDTTNTCIGASLNRRKAFEAEHQIGLQEIRFDTQLSHTQMIKQALAYNEKGRDVVIDCNAALEDFVLTAMTIADVIVLPSRPGRWDLEAWERMTPWLDIVFANRKRNELKMPKVFSVITDASKSHICQLMDTYLQGYSRARYLGQIRHAKALMDLCFDGVAIWEVRPNATVAKEFKWVVDQIIS